MQSRPRDWDRRLEDLLAKLEAHYEHLSACMKSMREALVSRDHPKVISHVKELQAFISEVKAGEQSTATSSRGWGILKPTERFTLGRLAASEAVHSRPELGQRLEAVARAAQRASRDGALNRKLIERLSIWNQREIEILLQPLAESVGYSAQGTWKDTSLGPAMLDKRG
ncbi:MAG: flagellar export chaperone FlgN [Candidatus Eisenbacteria sp.]|nr:flagellar export chaperone FlgN [Candidatus Eisenbacteria bacterium]